MKSDARLAAVIAVVDAANAPVRDAVARFEAQLAPAHDAAARIAAQLAPARAAADQYGLGKAVAMATACIVTDPEREREIKAAIDRVEALERRDPEAAAAIMDQLLADSLLVARNLPAPAHRPKGRRAEAEDQLRRLDELLRVNPWMSDREAAASIVPPSATRNKEHRVKYLLKLRRKERRGKN